MYSLFFKRGLDILISGITIIFLSPIYIITGIVIYLQDFGPIIFKQQRIGQNGNHFLFFKFRSMPVNTPNVQSTDVSKLKITPFGKIIRRTSIDELPQLFNILIGDMSIVGPRPSISSQINLIELRKTNGSLSLKPGLTGYAQINSYDFMPETEKAKFDGYYFKNISFLLDLKIIFSTFLYLLKKPPTY